MSRDADTGRLRIGPGDGLVLVGLCTLTMALTVIQTNRILVPVGSALNRIEIDIPPLAVLALELASGVRSGHPVALGLVTLHGLLLATLAWWCHCERGRCQAIWLYLAMVTATWIGMASWPLWSVLRFWH